MKCNICGGSVIGDNFICDDCRSKKFKPEEEREPHTIENIIKSVVKKSMIDPKTAKAVYDAIKEAEHEEAGKPQSMRPLTYADEPFAASRSVLDYLLEIRRKNGHIRVLKEENAELKKEIERLKKQIRSIL